MSKKSDNIIKYCNRPFKNIWDMHEAIVSGMNSVVQPNDELFILGDVSFYGGEKVQNVLNRINGRKHLILGNHDAKNMKDWTGWTSVNHYLEVKDSGQFVVLSHYPIESWNRMTHGGIHLHGHRHGVGNNHRGFREDVGVDPWGFKPVSVNDLGVKWMAQGKLV
jgi:calcineurin-like phosphoesterase family protein